MKHKEPSSTSPRSLSATDATNTKIPTNPAIDERVTTDDTVLNIDRPGLDLGGASGNTQSGTGLGLGADASDSPDERRLPGRRLDNELTIPRWSGQAPRGAAAPGSKSVDPKTPPDPAMKKDAN